MQTITPTGPTWADVDANLIPDLRAAGGDRFGAAAQKAADDWRERGRAAGDFVDYLIAGMTAHDPERFNRRPEGLLAA